MARSTRSEEPVAGASSLRRWTGAAIVISLVLAGFVAALVVRSRHQAARDQAVADAVTRFALAVHRDPAAAERLLCRSNRSAYAASVLGGLVKPAGQDTAQVSVSRVRRDGASATARVVPRRLAGLATRVTLKREGGRWRLCEPSRTVTTVVMEPARTPPIGTGATDALCAPVRADVRRARAAISAHNALPHVFPLPAEQARLDAYDARARLLNRRLDRAADRDVACRTAALVLGAGGRAPLRGAPSDATLAALRDAGSDRDDLTRALLEHAPPSYGDVRLQGRGRPAVGDPDPAFAGGLIVAGADGPAVSSVPVVAVPSLLHLRRVVSLSPRNLYAVAYSPLNQQWASTYAVAATTSTSMGRVLGLAPAYPKAQQRQGAVVEEALDRAVRLLVASQG